MGKLTGREAEVDPSWACEPWVYRLGAQRRPALNAAALSWLQSMLPPHGAAGLDWGRLDAERATFFIAGDRTEEQLEVLESSYDQEPLEGVWATPDDTVSSAGSMSSWHVEELGASRSSASNDSS